MTPEPSRQGDLDGDREFSLSPGQEALWLLYQLSPESAVAYNQVWVLRVRMRLSLSNLRRAAAALVVRHAALRTTFHTRSGRPLQRLHENLDVDFSATDVGALEASEVRERLHADAGRPFDLERGPLFRLAVFSRSAEEHLLLMGTHHVYSDFWSAEILVRELWTLYGQELGWPLRPLVPPAKSFRDYLSSQDELLAGEEGERLWSFWRRRLRGELPVLELPVDRPRKADRTYSGARVVARLDPQLSAAVRSLGESHGASLYTALLAAFEALLHRGSGAEDLLVGTPTALRGEGFRQMVGYCVNPVVLRAEIRESLTFAAFLERTRHAVRDALKHRSFPFPRLVERLQPAREAGRPPLFQVMFAFQKAQSEEPWAELLNAVAVQQDGVRTDLPGGYLESTSFAMRVALFDLTVTVAAVEGRLSVAFIYDTDLFDRTTVSRLLGHFTTLLASIVQEPDGRISELPLLRRAQRHQILVEWNDTGRKVPSRAERETVVRRLERQVAATPDAPAVVEADGRTLSFRELNARANQLCRHLRRRGGGRGALVGIHVERSLEMAVAVLGVMKAGAACLPLDPSFPPERLAFILEESQVALVLTQESLRHVAPKAAGVVRLDSEWPRIARESSEDPAESAGGLDLAYVAYTSGSTGRPKGIALPHGMLGHLIAWHLEEAGLLCGVRTLQFASLSFDISFYEMLITWCSGGTLVLAPEASRTDISALVRFLSTARVEKAIFPVVVLQRLAEECLALDVDPGLREITTSGEQLLITPSIVRFFERFETATLHNLYGPSETHAATDFPLPGRPGDWSPRPPIGRPITETTVFLLSHRGLEPVPYRVPGELCIGGASPGRGYLGRPAQTAEKFIPDPFASKPGQRLYRTGDRARYRSDGVTELLGRFDHQVKVRGFRVELGEIEALLQRHPDVAEAAVLAQQEASGNRLVAYVAAAAVDGKGLREFLRQKLPDYMVPTRFVRCDALPLTPTGKLDRRALSRLDDGRDEPARPAALPRTPTERIVAEVWESVLGLKDVRLDDDFFESGGHSLVATQMAARIHRLLEVEIPFKDFFDVPTVAALAKRIDRLREARTATRLPPVERAPRDRPLPLSFSQQRLWFLDQVGLQSADYVLPLGIELNGRLDIASLNRALEEIVGRHEILRTVFDRIGEQPVQIVSDPKPGEVIRRVDLREVPGAFQESVVRHALSEQTRRPFHLARGPLLRATLWILGDARFILLITMHHIASDGGSAEIFVRELLCLYEAFSSGRGSPLPDLPVQYGDYALWQREATTEEIVRPQLEYWKRQLADLPEVFQLPTDRRRPSIPSYRGAASRLKLDRRSAEKLKAFGHSRGASLFMSLTALFQCFLHRVSEQRDIFVGSPIAHRRREELEGLIGLFVNNLVLRSEVTAELSFAEVLRRARATALDAYAHQDVPFERIVEEVRPQRDLGRTPLFQVVFVLQDLPRLEATNGELEWRRLDLEYNTVRFDLELHMWESPEGLDGVLAYRPDLFDATTAARWARALPRLAAAVAEDPDRRLGTLGFLGTAERHQLVTEWNAEAGDADTESIPALFERQAAERCEDIALICGEERWTYGELNRRAGDLARRLRCLGVGPEKRVGLAVEASPAWVIALLAALKAGAAVVPLDLASPPDRWELMLRDAEACALLHQGWAPSGPWLSIDVEAPDATLPGGEEEPVEVDSRHLAYLIYTSGTTGLPKAVAVTHGQVVPILRWGCRYFGLGAHSRVLQTLSPGFDFGLFEVLTTLLAGGTLHFLPAAERGHAARYAAYVAEHGINTVHSTPSFFRDVVDLGRRLPSLELVHLGGERLSRSLVRRISALTRDTCRIYNGYGPTEASVNCTVFRWPGPPDRAVRGEEVPIGRVTARNAVYLLDRSGKPAPWCVPGELVIGGAGVARGYLRRPALTAERFVPDAWGERGGARLYRSGDLARRLGDGQILYLGRIDQQLKIRGTRIEPAEIEAFLRRHPKVADAAVTAWESGGEDPRLAAYVVPGPSSGETTPAELVSELQGYLRSRLPAPMQPTAWSLLAALPRNAAGKLDRRALPVPEAAPAERAAPFVAPRNDLERSLAALWRRLLKVETIGIDDNFFDAGGHSLLLLSLHRSLRERFGGGGMVDLFQYPTIRGLAAHLGKAGNPDPATAPLGRSQARTSARQEVDRQRQSRRRHRARSYKEGA